MGVTAPVCLGKWFAICHQDIGHVVVLGRQEDNRPPGVLRRRQVEWGCNAVRHVGNVAGNVGGCGDGTVVGTGRRCSIRFAGRCQVPVGHPDVGATSHLPELRLVDQGIRMCAGSPAFDHD